MHTHPILAAAYVYAWLAFAAALILALGTIHRLAKLMMELSLAAAGGELTEIDRQRLKRTLTDAAEGLESLRGAA